MNHPTIMPAADDRDLFDARFNNRATDNDSASENQVAPIIAATPAGISKIDDGGNFQRDQGNMIIPIISDRN